jgi:hypothetical protein
VQHDEKFIPTWLAAFWNFCSMILSMQRGTGRRGVEGSVRTMQSSFSRFEHPFAWFRAVTRSAAIRAAGWSDRRKMKRAFGSIEKLKIRCCIGFEVVF